MFVLNVILGAVELLLQILAPYYLMKHLERDVYRKKYWYFLGFSCYVLMILILSGINSAVLFLAAPLALGVLGYLLFHRQWQMVLYDVLYWAIVELMQFSIIHLLTFLGNFWEPLRELYFFANLSLVIKNLILPLLTLGMLKIFTSRKQMRATRTQIISFFILPVASLLLLLATSYLGSVYVQLYGIGLMVVIALIVIGINLYFIYMIRYQAKASQLEQELSLYRQQSELKYHYYEEMEKKYQKSRKVLHDMKNHLQAVERLYEEREPVAANRYVKDMYHMINVLGERYYTDNKMLNIILNDKLLAAEQEGIRVSVQIADVDLSFLKEIDQTTIFANLLDNALEAVRRVKKEPYIMIKLDSFHDFLVVRITNAQEKRKEGGERCFWEKRAGHSGLGLLNVKKTLEAYKGSLQTSQTDGEYQVSITLPIGSVITSVS